MDFWTRCFLLPQTVHDRGGHLGSHRLHLRPLGVQVSSFKAQLKDFALAQSWLLRWAQLNELLVLPELLLHSALRRTAMTVAQVCCATTRLPCCCLQRSLGGSCALQQPSVLILEQRPWLYLPLLAAVSSEAIRNPGSSYDEPCTADAFVLCCTHGSSCSSVIPVAHVPTPVDTQLPC